MIKIKRWPVFIFLLFLMIMLILCLPTYAASRTQIIIVDLFRFDILECSKDYPNLLKFISTSAIGLVPLPSTGGSGDALGRHLFKDVWGKDGDNVRSVMNSGAQRIKWPGIYIDSQAISAPHNQGIKPAGSRLRYYDSLLGRLLKEIDFETTLVLICSTYRSQRENTELASVMLKGPNFSTGVLFSPNTRKRGIITYNDLRATIARSLRRKTGGSFGLKSGPGRWQTVAASQPGLLRNYAVRWPLLTGYAYLMLGVIFLFIFGIVFQVSYKLRKLLVWGYLFLLTFPAAFLLEAIINPLSWAEIIGYTFGTAGLLFLSAYYRAGKNIFKTLFWISLFTVGTVALDGLFNGCYEYRSFLGYSVVSGSRYYGIGNEYMGILLGSYIAVIALSFQNFQKLDRRFLWSISSLIALLFIHPSFGADVGGGITALMGLGMTNYLWLKQPIRGKEIFQLLTVTILLVFFIGSLDYYSGRDSMSHLGQLILAIQSHGLGVLFNVAVRKMELNLRLISGTPLAWALIAFLVFIPFVYQNSPAFIKRLKEKYGEIVAGLAGLCITALFGLIANDSGIVSAAMLFMFGIALIGLITDSELNCM